MVCSAFRVERTDAASPDPGWLENQRVRTTMNDNKPIQPAPNAAATKGDQIVLGGGYRLPSAPATSDSGKIRLGGGYRLPNARRD